MFARVVRWLRGLLGRPEGTKAGTAASPPRTRPGTPARRTPVPVAWPARSGEAAKQGDGVETVRPGAPRQGAGTPQAKHVNIGIDFGTSSTKVVFREVLEGRSHVCGFHEGLLGYPSFALPSTIRVKDGHLSFGAEAERLAGGVAFRSVKICLGCCAGIVPCRGCDAGQLSEGRRGWFSLDAGGVRDTMDAHELVTLFLAYVIGRAQQAVSARVGRVRTLKLTYNMCLPVDQFESGTGRDAFLRALFLAEKLAGRVTDGLSLAEARLAYRGALAAHPEVPSEGERVTYLQPESVAALMPFVLSRTAQEGLYGIVDVGAGTTDTAFFRLSRLPEPTMSVYHARTEVVGGDDMDRALFEAAAGCRFGADGAASADVLQAIRLLKHELRRGTGLLVGLGERQVELGPDEIWNGTAGVVDRIFTAYQAAWRGAYRVEPIQSRWMDLRLFPIGGGARVFLIHDRFLREPPFAHVPIPELIDLPRPEDLSWAELAAGEREEPEMIAVAYGLSYHPAQFPTTWLPSEMGPPRVPRPPRDLPDLDEWYPK